MANRQLRQVFGAVAVVLWQVAAGLDWTGLAAS